MWELYAQLIKPRQKIEEYKSLIESIDADLAIKIGQRTPDYEYFDGGKIHLPSPFDFLAMHLSSNGISYNGCFSLFVDQTLDRKFNELSSDLFERAKNINEYKIIPVGNSLLIELQRKIPLFKFSKDYPHFTLDFGRGGTAKRSLENYEQFETDVNYATQILTGVVNACYDEETPDIEYQLYL